FGVVQRSELVCQPRDGEALAAACTVLDQIAMPCSALTRIRDQPPYRVQLVITRNDEALFTRFLAFVIFDFDDLNKLIEQIQHTVFRPDVFPEIGGGEVIVARWVARAVVAPAIEREKERLIPAQM